MTNKAKIAWPCDKCGHKTDVVDSRPMVGKHGVRRRRRCEYCGYRATTFEISEQDAMRLSHLRENTDALLSAARGVVKRVNKQQSPNTP